jgi:hypothetical protein
LLRPIDEQGYVIVAIDNDQCAYTDCARTLAHTVKHWDPSAKVCLITDNIKHNDAVYDHCRVIDNVDTVNAYANDWRVFKHTPFRETIKLEADMLIVSDIAHWWNMFRHRDVVISTGCRNWRDEASTARNYRSVFDKNSLPDVYNAITYWRLSDTAREFFELVRDIFLNWAQFKSLLKSAPDVADTDLIYAIAAQIMGPERVTLPFASYPKIVHMKQHIAGTHTRHWPSELVWEYHDHELRINTVAQWGAFHYHHKDWRP